MTLLFYKIYFTIALYELSNLDHVKRHTKFSKQKVEANQSFWNILFPRYQRFMKFF